MYDLPTLQNTRVSLCKLLEFVDGVAELQRTMHQQVGCPGGQDGEDTILRQLLPLQPAASYLDIGAYGPVETSNTWQFYQAGWRGLLVDPLPACWGRLLLGRPGDHVMPVAAGAKRGIARLRIAEACSSLNRHWNIAPTDVKLVELWPTRDILALFPAIRDTCQLCSIDVEGSEREVLAGIDWGTFRPRVIVIEYVVYPDTLGLEHADELTAILAGQNYRLYWRGRFNLVFATAEHLAAIGLPPCTDP